MTWSTVYTCWARIATLKTQEQYGAGEFDAQVSHRVTIRYPYETTGMIHAGQRVVYKQRHFKVQTIDNPNESNKVLYLMCIEVQDVDESKS